MKTICISALLLFSSWISLSAQTLVAYYPFTFNANDVSGNEYHAALYGTATANDTLLIGNDQTDFAVLPTALLSALTDFTIAFKVKFNSIHMISVDPLNTIVSAISGLANNEDELVLAYDYNSSALQVTVKNTTMSFPFNAYVGQWYCIYVIRNDNQVAVFIDGLQAGNVQVCPIGVLTVPSIGYPCVLGQKEDSNTGDFNGNQSLAGKLDDLKFYDYAFSAQEVTEDCPGCNDRVFYPFTFDASDYSWNNLDGSIHGAAVVSDGALTCGDNTNDYLTVPDEAINGLNDFDISFSVKFDVLHDTGSLPVNTILNVWGINHSTELRVRTSANSNVLKIGFLGGEAQYSFTPSQDQWYCFHVQRRIDTLLVYVNAQLIGASHVGTTALTVSPGGIVIGQQEHCPGGCFQENQSLAGSLDYFKISNCALPVPSDETCINTSVMSIPHQDSFSIFPNPADEFVKINFSQSKKVTASVFNMLGEEVLRMNSINPQELILPTKNLLPGIYLLKLYDGNRNFSQKLVVNH